MVSHRKSTTAEGVKTVLCTSSVKKRVHTLSGHSNVSHSILWFRIENRTPRCKSPILKAPTPRISDSNLLWLGREKGLNSGNRCFDNMRCAPKCTIFDPNDTPLNSQTMTK